MAFVILLLLGIGLLALSLPVLLTAILFYEYQKLREPATEPTIGPRGMTHEPGTLVQPELAPVPIYVRAR